MTLIAAIRIGDHPFIISDLLVSSADPKTANASIPTVRDVDQVLQRNEKFRAVGLIRKTVSFSGSLAFAGAGGQDSLEDLFVKMGDFFSAYEPEEKYLLEFFDTVDLSEHRKEQLVGLVARSSPTNSRTFYWDGSANRLEFDQDFVVGSGRPKFDELRRGSLIDPGDAIEEAKAVSLAVNLAGGLIADQVATGTGLTEAFGGGIELISLQDGKLLSITNVAYVVFVVNFLDETHGQFINLSCFQYYYRKSHLIIRVGWPSFTGSIKGRQGEEIHCIGQLVPTDKISTQDISSPPDDPNQVCAIVVAPRKAAGEYFIASIDFGSNDNSYVRIHREDGNFGIDFHKEFIKLIGDFKKQFEGQ